MLYIDCDGVILNTESFLFNDYPYEGDEDTEERRRTFVEQANWHEILRRSSPLDDSVEILKKHDPREATILTKVCSVSEAQEKIDYFRSIGIQNNIIIVPIYAHKADVVMARGSILVDDSIDNLDYWHQKGGRALYYGPDEFYQKRFERVPNLKVAFAINRRFVTQPVSFLPSDKIKIV